MNFKRFTVGVLAALLLLSLVSCATTTFTHTWLNSSAERADNSFGKILVLGMSVEPSVRRTFEFSLRQQLLEHGVDAMSTLEIVGHNQEVSRETFDMLFGDRDIDAVIVSRLVGVETDYRYETDYTYAPYDYYHTFGDYYHTSYPTVYSQTYITAEQRVIVETNLYDTKDGKLVWSGTSETLEQDSAMDVIDSLNKALIKELISEGLIEEPK